MVSEMIFTVKVDGSVVARGNNRDKLNTIYHRHLDKRDGSYCEFKEGNNVISYRKGRVLDFDVDLTPSKSNVPTLELF